MDTKLSPALKDLDLYLHNQYKKHVEWSFKAREVLEARLLAAKTENRRAKIRYKLTTWNKHIEELQNDNKV